ncbi:thiamine phosphate synthase [Anaerococcus sp. ENR1011]|uniref:Thiamine phosphate synthase n=1 Tax=Anaerococcus groningensis TaxID=3115616 RepID=A0ABW9N0T5_9FIRM
MLEKPKDLCHSYNIPLLVDDRVDIALAADLDGVNLGNEDMDVADARRILGAIFETKTHVKTTRTSVETLKEINDNISIPTVAIGGLNYENIDILKNSGASGVSVVRAIMDSEDPFEDSKKLKEKIVDILDLQ